MMAEDKSRWATAAAKLLKLTQEGRLRWKSVNPRGVAPVDDENLLDAVFESEYKDRRLRLFRREYKVHEPSNYFALSTVAFPVKEYPYWTSSITLDILDRHDQSLWTMPRSDALRDLYTAVQHQVAGVDELLEELLSDEEQVENGS